jgi:hypothetical protein
MEEIMKKGHRNSDQYMEREPELARAGGDDRVVWGSDGIGGRGNDGKRPAMHSPADDHAALPAPNTSTNDRGNIVPGYDGEPPHRGASFDLDPTTTVPPKPWRAAPADPKLAKVQEVIDRNRDELLGYPGVVDVRPGYRFRNGWITDEPAIVAAVSEKRERSALVSGNALPPSIGAYKIDVVPATPLEQLLTLDRQAAMRVVAASNTAREEYLLSAGDTEAIEAARTDHYQPPKDVPLDEVTASMSVLCHTSPDAGWPVLGEFLDGVRRKLTVAMYDFTAPHLLRGLKDALRRAGAELDLILDPGLTLTGGGDDADNPKAGDVDEESVVRSLARQLGKRLDFTWAAVKRAGKTTGGIFPSAYHIKVAVADDGAFWLSSGNWQSSNQPDIDPLHDAGTDPATLQKYNREWHVVVTHPGLASTFRRYIEWDASQAKPLQSAPEIVELPPLDMPEELFAAEAAPVPRYFTPRQIKGSVRVQPLLTPDNYAELVLPLIRSARKRLYFQNQYINVAASGVEQPFQDLLDALREKIDDGLDVRIILRDLPKSRTMLTNLKSEGFDVSKIRLQPQCHNKGMVIDSQAVLVGSHNWSNEGVLHNRDASLIFRDERIAKFYEEVFLWDWENLARPTTVFESAMPRIGSTTAFARFGTVRVPWTTFFED